MLEPEFYRDFVLMCSRLGCNPVDLLSVLYSESGLNPAAFNPQGPAVGINQFMPIALKGVGYQGGVDGFKLLSATQQLPFVERYMGAWKSYLRSPGLIYLANFLPAYLSLAAAAEAKGEDYVLASKGDTGFKGQVFLLNAGLDINRDGRISLQDLYARVAQIQAGAGFQPHKRAILAVQGAAGPSAPSPALSLSDVQASLNKLGALPALAVDGVLGTNTEAALKSFQASHGLAADGVPGPLTLAALQAALASIPPKASP